MFFPRNCNLLRVVDFTPPTSYLSAPLKYPSPQLQVNKSSHAKLAFPKPIFIDQSLKKQLKLTSRMSWLLLWNNIQASFSVHELFEDTLEMHKNHSKATSLRIFTPLYKHVPKCIYRLIESWASSPDIFSIFFLFNFSRSLIEESILKMKVY